jgi:hypothetical protein
MVLAVVLVVLALILGGVGLLVEGLKWALIVALVLLVAGVIAGAVNRRQL